MSPMTYSWRKARSAVITESVAGIELTLVRPQTEEEWDTWLQKREAARTTIRSHFCSEHESCQQEAETLVMMLGLDNDRWQVETTGRNRI